MDTIVTFSVLFGAALLIAWLVNVIIGVLSGERPRDTFRVWQEIVLDVAPLFGVITSKPWRARLVWGLIVLAGLALAIWRVVT